MRGIGAGETLTIDWPGPQHGGRDPLYLFAALFLDQLVDLLRRAVATTVNAYPRRWRSAPLASPEHCEEALIEAAIARGEAVHRSRTASPAAVLGVRVEAANDTRAADTRAATATKGEPRRVVPPHPHGIVSTSCCPIAGATLAGTRFCTTRRA